MVEKLAGRAITGRVAFFLSGLIDLGVLTVYLMRRRRQRRRNGGRVSAAVLVAIATMLLVGMLSAAGAPGAEASTNEQSILMDDYAFIYSDPAQVLANLEQAKSLGVTTIKVSMVWSLVAPDPNATTEPNFDATNPAAYPAGNWTRYDDLVEEASALGLRVYFQLTAPAPLWATSQDDQVYGQEKDWSHYVNPLMFEAFVDAVGERYSGTYPTAGDGDTNATPDPNATIPAVNEWGIWNEPNETQWLSPQTASVNGQTVLVAPVLERWLTDAGYNALNASGHGDDTILIGETSSLGATHTIPFLQAEYCLGSNYQPLTGTAASNEDCPTSGSRQSFVQQNRGLFAESGYADHPYDFADSPNTKLTKKPWAMDMANLGALGTALDRIDAAYGEGTGLPIYCTEWGYKSNPPNPLVLTSLTQQEDWLDEGYYMSYFMPRLKSMAQLLLYDQPPTAGTLPGDGGYWAEFDTGLEFEDGQPKPALAAYRLPIWIQTPKTSTHLQVWAQIRPAVAGDDNSAELQFKASGTGTWINFKKLTTSNADGFINTTVSVPSPGSIRLAWADRTTPAIDYSRTVRITG